MEDIATPLESDTSKLIDENIDRLIAISKRRGKIMMLENILEYIDNAGYPGLADKIHARFGKYL